ncbi:unnamed protein product, partial [Dibothriocephalus latus]
MASINPTPPPYPVETSPWLPDNKNNADKREYTLEPDNDDRQPGDNRHMNTDMATTVRTSAGSCQHSRRT